MLVEFSHAAEDMLIETIANGRQAHEDCRAHVVDDGSERAELFAGIVEAREVRLVGREHVAAVVGDEALGVDEREAAARLVLGEALALEEGDDLLGHADGGGAGAHEDDALVAHGHAGASDGVDDAREHHGPGALHVVVEHGVTGNAGRWVCRCAAVALETGKGVFEVLVLDDDAGPTVHQSLHQLVQENNLLLGRDLPTSTAHVQWIVDELLVAGAEVESQRQCALRTDTTARTVQRQLTHRDSHAIDAQITESQDPRPIRHNGDIDMVARPVPQHARDPSLVRIRHVQTLGRLIPDLRPALARLADDGRVDERKQLLSMADGQPVEEVGGGDPQGAQVLVFVDVGGFGTQLLQASPLLCLVRFDGGRNEAVGTEVAADGGRVRGVVRARRRQGLARRGSGERSHWGGDVRTGAILGGERAAGSGRRGGANVDEVGVPVESIGGCRRALSGQCVCS